MKCYKECPEAEEGMYVDRIHCCKDDMERSDNDICPWLGEVSTSPDMVNQPPHYTQGGVECIDAIKAAVTGKPPYEAWLTGQIIKYIWRYNFKNGVEDVKKADFYLKRLIDILEEPNE